MGDYSKKNFIEMSKEIISIANYLQETFKEIEKQKIDADYYDLGINYFKLCFLPNLSRFLFLILFNSFKRTL